MKKIYVVAGALLLVPGMKAQEKKIKTESVPMAEQTTDSSAMPAASLEEGSAEATAVPTKASEPQKPEEVVQEESTHADQTVKPEVQPTEKTADDAQPGLDAVPSIDESFDSLDATEGLSTDISLDDDEQIGDDKNQEGYGEDTIVASAINDADDVSNLDPE